MLIKSSVPLELHAISCGLNDRASLSLRSLSLLNEIIALSTAVQLWTSNLLVRLGTAHICETKGECFDSSQ